MKLLYLPFIIQGFTMFVDEFYFHEKRGLPRWERWGHPLDTLSVLACLGYLILGRVVLENYLLLSVFSCLLITKDEFIHNQKCSGKEQWIHSLLFILHPLSFIAAYFLWKEQDLFMIKLQWIIIALFMFYQILRWSLPWQTQSR